MPHKDPVQYRQYHRDYYHRNKTLTGRPESWHSLSDVNAVERSGVCSICGPTKLSSVGSGVLKCAEGARLIRRRAQLKRDYGLTLEQFEEMWKAQDGKCAICRKALYEGAGGSAVDHCHETGKIRGLLCMPCNTSLGKLNTVELLRAAIDYLEQQ